MSSFQGPLHEYPDIVIDCFKSRNLNANAFFLSHCHKDHMEGLDSSLFSETLRSGSSKGVHLYCSETTKNLIKCDYSLSHLDDYTRGIPLNEPTAISLTQKSSNSQEEEHKVLVTLLPAGHCVGSVMFLFEGKKGNVLYTGDFRLGKEEIERMAGIHNCSGVKKIKSVYVDTTFCTPSVKSLPSREESAGAICRIVKSWLRKGNNYIVQLICSARYGYEFIFKELATTFQTKIHISSKMYQLYSCLPDMIQHFTLNAEASQIHACTRKKYQKRTSSLHCGLKQIDGKDVRILRIKPSTMWFVMHNIYPENLTRCLGGLYRVLHSMHASYSEIRQLVGYLNPKYVFPTVPPALSLDILDAYKCFKNLQNDDPDSQEAVNSSNVKKEGRKCRVVKPLITAKDKISTCEAAKGPDEKLKETLFGDVLKCSPPVKRRRKDKSTTTAQLPTLEECSEVSPRTSTEVPSIANKDGSAMPPITTEKVKGVDPEIKFLLGTLSPPVRRKRKKRKYVF